MKKLWLLALFLVACSPRPVTRPPPFNVLCLSQGDTLFASDSVYAYSTPQDGWTAGGDHPWLFAVRVSHWKAGWNRRDRERFISSVAHGEVVTITGDCVVRRNR